MLRSGIFILSVVAVSPTSTLMLSSRSVLCPILARAKTAPQGTRGGACERLTVAHQERSAESRLMIYNPMGKPLLRSSPR